MRTYTIQSWMRMGTPGVEQGQMVSAAYGVDLQSGVILRCTTDSSDRSETWTIADLTDEEMDMLEDWEPAASGGVPSIESAYEPVRVVRATEI